MLGRMQMLPQTQQAVTHDQLSKIAHFYRQEQCFIHFTVFDILHIFDILRFRERQNEITFEKVHQSRPTKTI